MLSLVFFLIVSLGPFFSLAQFSCRSTPTYCLGWNSAGSCCFRRVRNVCNRKGHQCLLDEVKGQTKFSPARSCPSWRTSLTPTAKSSIANLKTLAEADISDILNLIKGSGLTKETMRSKMERIFDAAGVQQSHVINALQSIFSTTDPHPPPPARSPFFTIFFIVLDAVATLSPALRFVKSGGTNAAKIAADRAYEARTRISAALGSGAITGGAIDAKLGEITTDAQAVRDRNANHWNKFIADKSMAAAAKTWHSRAFVSKTVDKIWSQNGWDFTLKANNQADFQQYRFLVELVALAYQSILPAEIVLSRSIADYLNGVGAGFVVENRDGKWNWDITKVNAVSEVRRRLLDIHGGCLDKNNFIDNAGKPVSFALVGKKCGKKCSSRQCSQFCAQAPVHHFTNVPLRRDGGRLEPRSAWRKHVHFTPKKSTPNQAKGIRTFVNVDTPRIWKNFVNKLPQRPGASPPRVGSHPVPRPRSIRPPLGVQSKKALRQSCIRHMQCRSNLCLKRRCAEKKAAGKFCSQSLECRSNLCRNKRCAEKKAAGKFCSRSLECRSNLCRNKRCARPQSGALESGGQDESEGVLETSGQDESEVQKKELYLHQSSDTSKFLAISALVLSCASFVLFLVILVAQIIRI